MEGWNPRLGFMEGADGRHYCVGRSIELIGIAFPALYG